MKKNKLLVMLACLGLLVTGCNGGGSKASTESTKAPTSSKQPSTQTTQSQPASTSSSQEEPPADDDYYYSLPFDAAAKDSGDKWKKGYESVWTFKVSKDHAKMDFAFAAKMSSSSHGDRSLYTNHEGASSSDQFESNEANDGTCRIELKVNGVAQTVTTKTYSEAGLDSSDFVYFRVASFAVTKGEVVVSMKTHASTGYRLMLGEGAERFASDAVHMPVGVNKIDPLLAAVAAGGAVEETVGSREGLVKKRDEIVLHGCLLIDVEAELPVHGFQLVARFVHRTILPQLCPSVKSKSRDFLRIGLVSLGRAKGFIPEVLDELGIDGADEDAGIGKPGGHGLIITPCVLHADLRLTVQSFDDSDEFIDGGLRVTVIPGRQEHEISGLADRDGALLLGNINTNGVHGKSPCD